jgi:hypothetical protein
MPLKEQASSRATLSRTIWVALLSSLFFVAVTLRCPPSIYSDQTTQLQAVQSYLEGRTSFPNTILAPDPDDITKDKASWVMWWAPGFPVLTALVGKSGLSLGASVKVLVDTFFVVGCVSWAVWAYLFRLPGWLTYGLAATLPWIRYANNNLLQVSGEILTWGGAPLALLGAALVLKSWEAPDDQPARPVWSFIRGLGVGGLLGALYFLKYSGFLFSCGILLYLGWRWLTGLNWRRSLDLEAILIGTGIPVVAWNLVNHAMGGTANLVTASWHPHLSWEGPLFLVLELPLALADAGQMGDWLFMHSLAPSDWSRLETQLMGLPGLIWFIVLVCRHRPKGDVEKLALVTLLGNCLLLLTLWTVSNGIDYDRRFFAAAAIATLPLILKWLISDITQSRGIYRIASTVFLAFYIALPLGYGLVTMPMKAWRSYGYQTSESGIFDFLLAKSNLRDVSQALGQAIPAQGNYIWYCPDPLTYFELKGRVIYQYVDFASPDMLASQRYMTSAPLRLLMVMPDEFESSGKAELVRASFPQAKNWQKESLPGSLDNLWTADLMP